MNQENAHLFISHDVRTNLSAWSCAAAVLNLATEGNLHVIGVQMYRVAKLRGSASITSSGIRRRTKSP
ncbi:hypothetical protein THIOKS13000009 [Thiocapsa sp. KS1]|nr:hypothetical protein THIOKS13000009 [Thiocapsa sp. KS1]